MRLVEIFDQPYHLEWDTSDPTKITASFVTATGHEIGVIFLRFDALWDVSFFFKDQGKMVYSLTGNGDAARTLGTVVHAITEFVDRWNPQFLFFSSEDHDSTRSRLYATMLDKVLRDDHMELVKDTKDPALPKSVKRHVRTVLPTHRTFLLRKKQQLMELFDRPYHLQWDASDPRDVTAYFYTSSSNRVLINFVDLGNGVTEINFMMELKDPESGFASRTFDPTGTGDAPRIFATVIGAIRDYVLEHEPDYIWFSAKENETSRIRLYDAMIKRALGKDDSYELLPSSRWRELPDKVEDLIRLQSKGFRGWLFQDRRLTTPAKRDTIESIDSYIMSNSKEFKG